MIVEKMEFIRVYSSEKNPASYVTLAHYAKGDSVMCGARTRSHWVPAPLENTRMMTCDRCATLRRMAERKEL